MAYTGSLGASERFVVFEGCRSIPVELPGRRLKGFLRRLFKAWDMGIRGKNNQGSRAYRKRIRHGWSQGGVFAASGQRNPRLIGSHHNGQVDCAEKAIGEAKSLRHVRHGICMKRLLRRTTKPTKAVTSEADDFD